MNELYFEISLKYRLDYWKIRGLKNYKIQSEQQLAWNGQPTAVSGQPAAKKFCFGFLIFRSGLFLRTNYFWNHSIWSLLLF